MNKDIVAAVICFAAGTGVAIINYLISVYILKNMPEKYSLTTLGRQVLHIGFLAAVYFIGEKTEYNMMYLLLGAVTGITLPMLVLTKKLLSLNEKISEKGDGTNG